MGDAPEELEGFARFAADRLGHPLPDWQVHLAERVLAGDPMLVWPSDRRHGRTTFAHLVRAYARQQRGHHHHGRSSQH